MQSGDDVWKGLYEFPLIETERQISLDELMTDRQFGRMFGDAGEVEVQAISPLMKHVLSHRRIFARFVTVHVRQAGTFLASLLRVPLGEVDRYAVSRLTDMFLESLE